MLCPCVAKLKYCPVLNVTRFKHLIHNIVTVHFFNQKFKLQLMSINIRSTKT